jgi:hypothetical protein
MGCIFEEPIAFILKEMMEAVGSSKILVDTSNTALFKNPEDQHLRTLCSKCMSI